MGWLISSIVFLSAIYVAVHSSNPPTSVMDLNEKFISVKDEGFWFVEFYAPWCAHCKRLMPIWEHVGHAVIDKNLPVRIAKMDCTRFTSACSSLSVQGYPTLLFFREGRKLEYHGERTKEALVDFVIKSSSPVVESINAVKLNEVRRDSRDDPAFLLIGETKDAMYEEFVSIADSLFSKTRFFSAKPESVPNALRESGARVAVFKDDAYFAYKGDLEGLRTWVMGERFSLMPRASPANIGDLSSTGKLLVLVISHEIEKLNRSSPTGVFHEISLAAASDMRKAEHLWDLYQFVWLDGSDIVNNIVMGSMEPPAIMVFNYTTYEYFLNDDDVEKISKQSILVWLENLAEAIRSGTAQPLGGRAFLTRIRRMAWEVYTNVAQMFATQPLLSSCLFGVPIAFLSIICYSICSADFSVERDEFYPEDEDEEEEEGDTETEVVADPNHQKNE